MGKILQWRLTQIFYFYQAGYNQNYKAAEKSGVNR